MHNDTAAMRRGMGHGKGCGAHPSLPPARTHTCLLHPPSQGKSEADIDKASVLFSEIQQQIDSKQLKPFIRTQYMRSAFQARRLVGAFGNGWAEPNAMAYVRLVALATTLAPGCKCPVQPPASLTSLPLMHPPS